MKVGATVKIVSVVLTGLLLGVAVAANDPIFVKWLVIDDPGDETIRQYWERAELGELTAEELVDLGTMLFYRGYPNDAIRYFREALDLDPDLSEAWFRIGLVNHREGDLADARSAYKKCLKKQVGHGWANFYLGLLEERTGDSAAALEHYRQAFKYAPVLADPRINPEILSSKLQLGAMVQHFDGERFEKILPMPYMEPAAVRKTMRQFEPPPPASPAPEAEPEPATRATATPVQTVPAPPTATRTRPSRSSTATGSAGSPASRTTGSAAEPAPEGTTPYGVPRQPTPTGRGTGEVVPQVRSTSPEASLRPLWPGLYELIQTVI